MATYSVKIISQCQGGEHILVGIICDGKEIKRTVYTRTELFNEQYDVEEALKTLVRIAVKESEAVSITTAKSALESKTWIMANTVAAAEVKL